MPLLHGGIQPYLTELPATGSRFRWSYTVASTGNPIAQFSSTERPNLKEKRVFNEFTMVAPSTMEWTVTAAKTTKKKRLVCGNLEASLLGNTNDDSG